MSQHNFLVLGLGGTGCKVVRELKKKLYIEWRSRGNTGPYGEVFEFENNLGSHNVLSKIATLSVDSNKADLEGEGELTGKWRVLGETLRLTDKEKLVIDPSGTGKILNSIDRYPGIAPWIEDEMTFVRDIARGSTEAAGCNQIRRMGRLALSCGGNITNLIARITDRLDLLSQNGQVGANIHIACTLGAGTGSGILVDTIVQIQKYLKNQDSRKFKIFVHAFATGKRLEADTGNFYSNQYAALLELNALKFGIYKPWDIKPGGSTRLRLSPPIPGEVSHDMNNTWSTIALITDNTEGGASVSFDQQIDNTAELIFQLSVRQAGNVPDSIRYALSGEDRSQKYPADINGGSRSTAFIGYGVQRVIIPEREIREKLTFSTAKQSLLQLLYNNWDDRFRETARNFSKDEFVNERRNEWYVSKEYLNLDLLNSDNKHRFEPYKVAWKMELERQQAKTKMGIGDSYSQRREWLKDFERRAANYWNKGFRSVGESGGVVSYFQNRNDSDEINTRARHLRDHIEKNLITGMEAKNPEYALHRLPDAVSYLISQIEANQHEFNQDASKAKLAYEEADKTRANIRKEYRKLGRLTFSSTFDKLFDSYVDATILYYINRTLYDANIYGNKFCIKFIERLRELKDTVFKFDRYLKNIYQNFNNEFNERISEEKDYIKEENIDYIINAAAINDVIRRKFENDKPVIEKNTDKIIKVLQTARGGNFKFSSYFDSKDIETVASGNNNGTIVNGFLKVSEEQVVLDHSKYCEDSEFRGILGQNIVQKLFDDYGGQVDGDLEYWLRKLMEKSMPMVSFDPNEEPMDLVGEGAQGPVIQKCIFIPKCPSVPHEFTQRIKEVVTSFAGERSTQTIYREMPEDRTPNEIVVISVAFFFPVRHTHLAHTLKDKYVNRLNVDIEKEKARGYFETHTETHLTPLPDLMKLGRDEELELALSVVLLAVAAKFMPNEKIPSKSGRQVFFGVLDTFGRLERKVPSGMIMNDNVLKAAAESTERFGQKISEEVLVIWELYFRDFKESSIITLTELLKKDFKDDIDVKSIEENLYKMSGQFYLLSGKDEEDEKYILFDQKSKEAIQLLKNWADKSKF